MLGCHWDYFCINLSIKIDLFFIKLFVAYERKSIYITLNKNMKVVILCILLLIHTLDSKTNVLTKIINSLKFIIFLSKPFVDVVDRFIKELLPIIWS